MLETHQAKTIKQSNAQSSLQRGPLTPAPAPQFCTSLSWHYVWLFEDLLDLAGVAMDYNCSMDQQWLTALHWARPTSPLETCKIGFSKLQITKWVQVPPFTSTPFSSHLIYPNASVSLQPYSVTAVVAVALPGCPSKAVKNIV